MFSGHSRGSSSASLPVQLTIMAMAIPLTDTTIMPTATVTQALILT
jgi:hypothetical protein